MHRPRPLAAALLVLLLGLTGAGCKARRVAVLFTTDEHSHLFAFAPELDDHPLPSTPGTGALQGGAARRATLLWHERMAAALQGTDSIVVSAGDWSQGTLSQVPFTVTNPDLVMLGKLGYSAVAIGNHEFDLGVPALAAAITAGQARGTIPQLLLTNVTFSGTAGDAPLQALYGERGSGKPVARSAIVKTYSGVRVGVVSQLGPAAAGVAPLAAPLKFAGGASYADRPAAIAAIAAQIQPEVDALHRDKVDLVLLLGHGGIATAPAQGDDQLLAAALHGVDLYVSGHTHRQPDQVLWVADTEGRQVPVMQAGPFGIELGRAEFVLDRHGQRPTLDTDPGRTRFIKVDDRTLPTTDPAVLGELDGVIAALETRTGSHPSFLEQTLTVVTGAPVVDDPTVSGDLYYKILGHTGFDIAGPRPAELGVRSGETNALNLDTDAMWAVANGFSTTTTTTDVAVQAAGAIRSDLRAGRTGMLSFADLYNVVPLGGDPVEGSPGYPLLRFYLTAAELWGAFEYTLLASTQDSDFYLSPAGIELAFDRSGPRFDPATRTGGWITRMTLVDRAGVRTPIFDKALSPATGGWLINPLTRLVSVVTTIYVAAFAQSAGLAPRDAAGVPYGSLLDAVLLGPGGFHWKDHQALALYVGAACQANGGTLPAVYDETSPAGQVPRRIVCGGPICP